MTYGLINKPVCHLPIYLWSISLTNLPDNNPKTRFGMTKPNIFLVPAASVIYQALAMDNGAKKYGPYNWRDNKVSASIYIAAAYRHMMSWVDGEEVADDSGIPHIAHAIACLGIIADAIETGNLIDDRPTKGRAADVIAKWTKPMTIVAPGNGKDTK